MLILPLTTFFIFYKKQQYCSLIPNHMIPVKGNEWCVEFEAILYTWA